MLKLKRTGNGLLEVLILLFFGAWLTSLAWGPLMVIAFLVDDNPLMYGWIVLIFAILGAIVIKVSQ